jgi:transposase
LDVFSYMSPEQRVPQDHPLRRLRAMTDEALQQLQSRFDHLYAEIGRPSIAPEMLLRALLLQVLYSVRSERMLMGQLDYNLLFRWFVGLNMDDPFWDATVFTKNRERMLDGDIADAFFQAVLQLARERNLLSDEHFTLDGTLLEAWASLKSFQRNDGKPMALPADPGNATMDFHGEKPSNQTHESKDGSGREVGAQRQGQRSQVELQRKSSGGEPQRLDRKHRSVRGQRNSRTRCSAGDAGTNSGHETSVGGDKAYDTADFVAECRNLNVKPHVAQNLVRPGGSASGAKMKELHESSTEMINAVLTPANSPNRNR